MTATATNPHALGVAVGCLSHNDVGFIASGQNAAAYLKQRHLTHGWIADEAWASGEAKGFLIRRHHGREWVDEGWVTWRELGAAVEAALTLEMRAELAAIDQGHSDQFGVPGPHDTPEWLAASKALDTRTLAVTNAVKAAVRAPVGQLELFSAMAVSA